MTTPVLINKETLRGAVIWMGMMLDASGFDAEECNIDLTFPDGRPDEIINLAETIRALADFKSPTEVHQFRALGAAGWIDGTPPGPNFETRILYAST